MNLLSAVAVLVLASSSPDSAPVPPGSSSGCATSNIETALRHLFERYKEGGPLDIIRDTGEALSPEFITTPLKILDVPNGYATLEGPDLIESFEAALFKNPEGYHLVVTSSGTSASRHVVFRCNKEGLTPDNTALQFSLEDEIKLYASAGLLSAKGKKGLTEQFLKDWAGPIVLLALPRKGRVITLKAGVDEPGSVYGKKLGTVEYANGKFIVHPLAKQARP
ncbi:hypothetical protein [Stigmatella aurantiaca]|uniref:Uncharacterized protein n=1 Tax=Stigmatella aurantiaca (strain DW4/3-1) TaxID=378806 RepID=Q099M6_STIAD|nr:hypothetical protein [Stigmatella aurantiaca]ADO75837.1 uncharacterized protein STAUR_8082 [Stigmatella aurantiaca DW4/3-1]EAU68442.1 hypothetical protein STIAU_3322 [Stigmatella aurantiaca DW4/3-1]